MVSQDQYSSLLLKFVRGFMEGLFISPPTPNFSITFLALAFFLKSIFAYFHGKHIVDSIPLSLIFSSYRCTCNSVSIEIWLLRSIFSYQKVLMFPLNAYFFHELQHIFVGNSIGWVDILLDFKIQEIGRASCRERVSR